VDTVGHASAPVSYLKLVEYSLANEKNI